MNRLFAAAIAAILTIGTPLSAEEYSDVPWVHGISMHGDVKYPSDFTHFDYANPKAPKGGLLRQATVSNSGYDTFNGNNIIGVSASGLGNIYETLMASAGDEAFTKYGQIAEYVKLPKARDWVAFRLNDKARWHDGTPITPEDVIWTFNTLMEKGNPSYRYYYSDVTGVEKVGPRDIKFTFASGENQELPLILGDLLVLPKHYWEGRDFAKTTLEPPLGSGAYKIGKFEANRFITYERVKDYWGQNLPVNKGMNNFDVIRYDYYSDSTIALEALKAGEYDLRIENTAKHWAFGYDSPAVDRGDLIQQEFEDNTAHGLQGFFLNQRRPQFQDPRVRQALASTFDFEWTNPAYFYGQYRRARSYFNASELEAKGLPKGRELELLEPYRGRIPDEVFTTEYNPPSTNRTNGLRENLLASAKLLEEAGWVIDPEDFLLKQEETGEVFTIEFMVSSPAMQRIVLPMVSNFQRLGIKATIRFVDMSQYTARFRERDYDAMVMNYGQSQSPGNEQRFYWGSAAADENSSYNVSGVKNDVIDELIESLIVAPTREEQIMRTRAMDRVLQWLHLSIPQYYAPNNRVAFWNRFGMPEIAPTRGFSISSWWVDEEKNAALGLRLGGAGVPSETEDD